MSESSNVDNTQTHTHARTREDAVCALCFQAEVILDGLNETGDLPRWEASNFDVMSY